MLAGLAPEVGVRWRGRLWGPVLSVAELRPALALPHVFDDFLVAVLVVLSGGSVAVVGSWLPGGGGYGFVAVAGRFTS